MLSCYFDLEGFILSFYRSELCGDFFIDGVLRFADFEFESTFAS